jgi:hypothetical protein
MEAGFGVIFRIPQDPVTQGINPATYPFYGGTILTLEQPPRTIIIDDDDVFYCSCRNQIGAELHIYLEEGTYHKRLGLFRGPSTNDMKK